MQPYSIISAIIFLLSFSLNSLAVCDFTTNQNVVITPGGNHNNSAGYTQLYLLVNENGTIVATSATGDFGTQNFGLYNAYAFNYEIANPPSTLPIIGAEISQINDGCGIFSAALQITVCNTSILTLCEDSGNDIVIAMNTDFNSITNYEEVIIVVDDVTGNILFVSNLDPTTGSVNYTTTSIIGDLTNGTYTAYSVNYENSETLIGLGLIVGNLWTGIFGTSCAISSIGASITVNICCDADAGATSAQTSDPSNNDFVLCWNESINLENLTYSLPGVGANEAFGYAVYSSPMPGTVPSIADPDFIEFLIGTGANASLTLTNDGSYTPPFINNPNQTIYIYPVTLDDATLPSIDNNGDNCYEVGSEIVITFLNNIIAPNSQDCISSSGVYTISGGYPEFFTGNYNITNQGDGTLSSTTLANSGGNISVDNLNIGDVYNIDITDDNNCSISTNPELYPSNLSYDSIILTPISCNSICDASISIYSANASQYSFNGGLSSGNSIEANLCGGSVTVSIEDNGCVIDSTIIIIEPAPILIANSNDTTICIGSDVSIFGNAQGGTPGYEYYWNNNIDNSVINVTTVNDSIISVYALDENNCSSDTNQISVSLFDSLSIQGSILDSICEGESIVLTTNGFGGNNNLNYNWTNNDGSGWTAFGNNITISPQNSVTYTVQLTDNCGTPAVILDIEILVNALPNTIISANYINGCYPLTAEFINSTVNINGNCNWSFSNGEMSNLCNPFITFDTPGCFDATLTTESLSGCSNTETFQSIVCVEEYPQAAFSFLPDFPNTYNSLVNFTNESIGNSTNSWTVNGTEFSNELNPFYEFNGLSGNYEICLVIANTYQCENTFCDTILIADVFNLYVPNTFSPDGNGVNDLFGPVVSEGLLEDYEMWIFNRWGEIIFHTLSIEDYWNGAINGTQAQQDTYIWRIKYKEANVAGLKDKTGHVNLIR